MKKVLALLALLLAAATHTVAASPPRLSEALTAQRELVAASSDDPGALNDLGSLLFLAGQLEEAEAAYQQALYWAPESATIHYNLGLLFQQQDNHEKAITELTKTVENHPENAWAHYQMGLSLEALGRDGRAAIDSYARAFFLDPRLAFADINPQVIDSRYLTAAMLQAHRRAPGRIVAPLSYQEPDRIAAILLPPPPPDDDHSPDIEWDPEISEPLPTAGPAGSETHPGEPGLPVDLTEPEQQRARALDRSQRLRTPTNRVTQPVDDPTGTMPADEDDTDHLFDDWNTGSDPDAADDFFEDFAPSQESTGRLDLRLQPGAGNSERESERQASAAETNPESTRGR